MMMSAASMMPARLSIASWRSTLATMCALPPAARSIARERHRLEVDALRGREADVLAIALRQRRCRDAAALAVEPLAVGQLAAYAHARVDGGRRHALDVEHDLAVVEQQRVAGGDILRQVLV